MLRASALPCLQAILRAQSHADQLSAIAEHSDTDFGGEASAGQVPMGHSHDHAVPGLLCGAEAEKQQLQDHQHGAAESAAAIAERQQPHSLSPDASSKVSGEAGPVEASQQHLSASRVQVGEEGASPADQGPSAALHLTGRQSRQGSLARGSSWVPQGVMQPLTPDSSGTVTPAAEGAAAQAGGGDSAAPAAGAMSRLAPGEPQATHGLLQRPAALLLCPVGLFCSKHNFCVIPCRVAQGRLLGQREARRGQQHGGGTCSMGQQARPAQT